MRKFTRKTGLMTRLGFIKATGMTKNIQDQLKLDEESKKKEESLEDFKYENLEEMIKTEEKPDELKDIA
jgi:hypothetical protein